MRIGIAWITAGPCGRSRMTKFQQVPRAVRSQHEVADRVVPDFLHSERGGHSVLDVLVGHAVTARRREDVHIAVSYYEILTAVGGATSAYPLAVTIAPERAARIEPDERTDPDRPWVTIVWDDPINLMPYVTYVFMKLFGYSREKATKLMLDVHYKGKAVVSSGAKEQMEFDVARLHAAGLWATLTQD